jgi:hypothetical protein
VELALAGVEGTWDSHVTGLTYNPGGTNLGNPTYTYDADGRRTAIGGSLAAVTLPTAVSGNTFNADNAMTAFGAQNLTYDANGNRPATGLTLTPGMRATI